MLKHLEYQIYQVESSDKDEDKSKNLGPDKIRPDRKKLLHSQFKYNNRLVEKGKITKHCPFLWQD
jgi:hypothetical protein